MKRSYILVAIAFVGFVGLGVSNITSHKQQIQLREVQLESKASELNKLNLDYKDLNVRLETEVQQKTVDQEKLKQLETEKAQLEQRQRELEAQLQAKAAEKERLASISTTQKVSASPAPSTAGSRGNCGDNMYKQYIYQHESGCDTNRWNSSGCYGIGQACPASKIAQCGADFACQDAWFTKYANDRYGSWAGAYQFWTQNHWW